MKKSVIIFAMLSAAIAFISCEENNLIKSRTESVTDSIHVSGDSAAVPIDTSDQIPVDTITNIPVDSINKNPADTVGTHDMIVPLTGDEFTFTPSIIDSASFSGLAFTIVSTKSYQCQNSYLNYNSFYQYNGSKTFKMSLNFVVQPGVKYCRTGDNKLLFSTSIYPVSEENTDFEILLEGTTYKGSITKTGNTYTINWPYTSGIKFSKLTITK